MNEALGRAWRIRWWFSPPLATVAFIHNDNDIFRGVIALWLLSGGSEFVNDGEYNGYPDYLVGMRERKVADKLNPQRISWLMAR